MNVMERSECKGSRKRDKHRKGIKMKNVYTSRRMKLKESHQYYSHNKPSSVSYETLASFAHHTSTH